MVLLGYGSSHKFELSKVEKNVHEVKASVHEVKRFKRLISNTKIYTEFLFFISLISAELYLQLQLNE